MRSMNTSVASRKGGPDWSRRPKRPLLTSDDSRLNQVNSPLKQLFIHHLDKRNNVYSYFIYFISIFRAWLRLISITSFPFSDVTSFYHADKISIFLYYFRSSCSDGSLRSCSSYFSIHGSTIAKVFENYEAAAEAYRGIYTTAPGYMPESRPLRPRIRRKVPRSIARYAGILLKTLPEYVKLFILILCIFFFVSWWRTLPDLDKWWRTHIVFLSFFLLE